MGTNLPAKKYKIGERTERYLQYTLSHTPANGGYTDSHFIDLAAGLSSVNKRFYRQGLYYYIKSISVVETTGEAKVQFGTAPDVWHVPQAWRLGKRLWDKMNDEASQGIPGGARKIAGAYHDFKIYLNENHRGDADNAVPSNGPESMDGNPDHDPDEWIYSKINSLFPANNDTPNDEDRDTFDLMLLGSSHTAGGGGADEIAAVSLCKSYLMSKTLKGARQEPHHVDGSEDDALLRIFDTTTNLADTLEDLYDDNDVAPYDADATYSDTIMRAQCSVGPTSNKSAMMPGFCVPFGLLEVLTTGNIVGESGNDNSDNNITVLIELAPGPYHGVYAERVE